KIPQVIDAPRGCVIGRAHIDDGDSLDRELMRPVAVLELTVTPGIADAGSYAAALQGHGAVGCSIVCDRGGRISLVPIRGGAEQSAHIRNRRDELRGSSDCATTTAGTPGRALVGCPQVPGGLGARRSNDVMRAGLIFGSRRRTDSRASRRSHLEALAH